MQQLPFLRPRTTISLSIEGATLRLLSSQGAQVTSWASIPFNPRFLRNGFVADIAGMGQVIRTALETRGLTRGRVVCALPGLQAVSRILTFPRLERANLEAVVTREVRRVMAVSPETSYLFWQALSKKEVQQRVYVLAVPKDPLMALLEALTTAGIRPRLMDLKPLALARAVNQKEAIIANGESNSIDIVIVVDDIPVLIRSLFLGEGMLDLEYITSRLSEELMRSIAFYNDTNRDNPLDARTAIYLTGESCSGDNFAQEVASLTGRPAPPLNPPLSYPPDFPITSYIVNIGLILKTL